MNSTFCSAAKSTNLVTMLVSCMHSSLLKKTEHLHSQAYDDDDRQPLGQRREPKGPPGASILRKSVEMLHWVVPIHSHWPHSMPGQQFLKRLPIIILKDHIRECG